MTSFLAVMRAHEEIARLISALPGVSAVGSSSSVTMTEGGGQDFLLVQNARGGGEVQPLRSYSTSPRMIFVQ